MDEPPSRPAPLRAPSGSIRGSSDTGYAALEGGPAGADRARHGRHPAPARRDPLEVRLEALFDGARTSSSEFAPDLVIVEDLFSAPYNSRAPPSSWGTRAAACLAWPRASASRSVSAGAGRGQARDAGPRRGVQGPDRARRAGRSSALRGPAAAVPRRRRARARPTGPVPGPRAGRPMIASLPRPAAAPARGPRHPRVRRASATRSFLPPVVAQRAARAPRPGDGAEAAELSWSSTTTPRATSRGPCSSASRRTSTRSSSRGSSR